jgi:hypothetical protein
VQVSGCCALTRPGARHALRHATAAAPRRRRHCARAAAAAAPRLRCAEPSRRRAALAACAAATPERVPVRFARAGAFARAPRCTHTAQPTLPDSVRTLTLRVPPRSAPCAARAAAASPPPPPPPAKPPGGGGGGGTAGKGFGPKRVAVSGDEAAVAAAVRQVEGGGRQRRADVRPIDPAEAARGRLDFAQVASWGTRAGAPPTGAAALDALQIRAFTPGAAPPADSKRPFYEQARAQLRPLALARVRRCTR